MDNATSPEGKAAALTEKIVEAFGGIRPMAAKLDMPVTTVQGWKKRGAIPAARHPDILAAAARETIAIDPDELEQTDPGGANSKLEARPPGLDRLGSASQNRGGSVALAVAGLALLITLGAGAAGWVLYVQPMEQRVASLESRVATLEPGSNLVRRLDVLEAEIAQKPPVAAGSQPSAQGNEAAPANGDRLAALEQQVADIKSGAAQTQELTKRLSDLQIVAGGRELLAQSIRDIQSSTAATQGEVERLDNALKAVGQRLDQVDAVLSERRQQALRAEAVVLAIGQLRAALHTSKPFAREIASVRAITADDKEMGALLDQLQPMAESGVPNEDDLRTEFGRLAPEIVRSSVVGDGSSWWRQMLYRVESVVSIRRVGQAVPGDKTDAIVARAEAKLDEDDLKSAVDTLHALAGLPAQVAAAWLHDAEQRIQVDAGEAELSRLAIDRVAAGPDRTASQGSVPTPNTAPAQAPPQTSDPTPAPDHPAEQSR
ncbi:MAG TPA: mitofilin family membrane protein [Alphaproteobacteria bacterium]|nr:mitofilin family membrane protein [Alphaproteobacteria bacterium]